MRPFKKSKAVAAPKQQASVTPIRPQQASAKISPQDLQQVRDKIIHLVQKDPAKAARILAEWVNQPSQSAQSVKNKRKAG